jgi:hypothetical protein
MKLNDEMIENLVKVVLLLSISLILSNKYSNILYDGTRDLTDDFLNKFFSKQPLIEDYVDFVLRWIYFAPSYLICLWAITILISTFTSNKAFKVLSNFSFMGILVLWFSGISVLLTAGIFLFVFYNESYCALS